MTAHRVGKTSMGVEARQSGLAPFDRSADAGLRLANTKLMVFVGYHRMTGEDGISEEGSR